jgi:hypothetical protein
LRQNSTSIKRRRECLGERLRSQAQALQSKIGKIPVHAVGIFPLFCEAPEQKIFPAALL